MAKETGIAWTRSTRGFWTGCTKIGPGCEHCYAEAFNKWVAGGRNWGPGAPRTPHLEGAARDLRHWNKQAGAEQAWSNEPWRVFINSQADIFDNEVPDAWRAFAFETMRECQNLQFILVTKRIGNAARMLPSWWNDYYGYHRRNIILMVTVCDQEEADRDVPKLLATPARWRGLSIEPQLGPIDLRRAHVTRERLPGWPAPTRVDWVIVGGESGPHARPFDIAWARSIVAQCKAAEVRVFVKQLGAHVSWDGMTCIDDGRYPWSGEPVRDDTGRGYWRVRLKDKAGADPSEWPEDLRVREFVRT